MEFIRVVNWEKFQHYGQRRAPPWIRLYNSLIENYQWGSLPDPAKAHLIGLYLLASRTGNKIPADPKWIAQRIQAQSDVDLNLLSSCGFIEEWNDAGKVLASGSQDDAQEESREEEILEKKRKETRAPGVTEVNPKEPSPLEVLLHARTIGYPEIDAEGFVSRYRALGWKLGATPIKDWRPLVERWKSRERAPAKTSSPAGVGRRLMLKLAQEEGLLPKEYP